MSLKIIAGALLTIAALADARAAIAIESDETYIGDAYDLDTGELLYRELHYRFNAGGTEQRSVLYLCPDGRPFGRKQLRDDGDAQAPDFDMVDARLNYREGVRRRGDQREVYVQRAAQMPEQSTVLAVPPNGVIDAGFDEFVRRHWDALAAGNSVSLPFLVPSKRAFYPFKVEKVENAATATTLTIRLSLGAWYAFLLPHIDVVYARAGQRLLRYEGVSNIRNADGKNYKVRIEFAAVPAVPLSPQQRDEALAAPLTAACAVVRADTAVPGAAN